MSEVNVSLRGSKEPPPSYGATQSTQFIADDNNSGSNTASGSSSSDISARIAEKVEDHLSVSVEGGSRRGSGLTEGDPFLSFHDITYEVQTGRLGIGGKKVVLKSVR